jgi:hypothetical protein
VWLIANCTSDGKLGTMSYDNDVNLTDGASHQLGLYALDWDSLGRQERVEILTEGENNWYYLDSNGTQMSYVSESNWWRGSETYNLLWANGGHPGNDADAVRQWRAPNYSHRRQDLRVYLDNTPLAI